MKGIKSKLLTDETVLLIARADLFKTLLTSKNTWVGVLLILTSLFTIPLTKIAYIFILIALLISLLLAIPTLINQRFTVYYITNKRIIKQSSIIGKDYDYTLLNAIVDVNVDVSILDKILNTGTLKFANSNVDELCVIRNVKNPHNIVNIALNQQ